MLDGAVRDELSCPQSVTVDALALPGPSLSLRPRRRHERNGTVSLGNLFAPHPTLPALRVRVFASDRERPLVVEANCTLIARSILGVSYALRACPAARGFRAYAGLIKGRSVRSADLLIIN